MIIAMIACVVLVGVLCVLAFNLATYAVPFMAGLAAARFAYHTGSGLIGAGLVGFAAGLAVFGVLVGLLIFLRSPILKTAIVLAFTAPAAVAGYELVWGIAHEYVPSAIWLQLFCISGGIFVGVSALLRLIGGMDTVPDQKVRPS
ncbi:hypothetical protein NFI95_16145 [Acetobacteraceae bacterium KSS8]|uniref:DUF1097 domain-containing protein n=1 Tax=Endosaccharibacter trunci TaxID=2812733 RepID=A0ABT1WAQ9_9PROT|nr:hypothetical protein [Acetobacteraceae bacterium KSS8]